MRDEDRKRHEGNAAIVAEAIENLASVTAIHVAMKANEWLYEASCVVSKSRRPRLHTALCVAFAAVMEDAADEYRSYLMRKIGPLSESKGDPN